MVASAVTKYFEYKKNQRLEGKTDQVATNLAKHEEKVTNKLDKIDSMTEQTHEIVNGGTTAILEIGVTSARALAKQTGTVEDIQLAEEAEKKLVNHTKVITRNTPNG